MERLCLDFLPDELILIICEYLKTDTSLTKVSDKYKCIYEGYIKLVHDGFINPFDALHTSTAKVFIYNIVTYNKDYPKEIVGYTLDSSTSNYFKRKYTENVSETIQKSILFIDKDVAKFLSHIIYMRKYRNDFLDHYNISHCYVYVIGNKYKLVINYECHLGLDIGDGIESMEWKDIWGKLETEDQNAILYQNGFPLRLLN